MPTCSTPKPLVIPCAQKVNCPGTDSPFANLTMEAPDSELFIGANFGIGILPRLGWSWNNPRGFAFCGSFVSQLAADLCAGNAGFVDNTDDPPGDPDGGHWRDQNGKPPPIFQSNAAACTVHCNDGLPFTFLLPAGAFSNLVQADADAAAQSFACTLAQVNKICIGDFDQSACLGQPYSSTATITGRGPFTFDVISGMVPPGLQLSSGSTQTNNNALLLLGNPTTVGFFSFTVRLTSPVGLQQQKTFTIVVWGFANSTTLAPLSNGSAYSFQFLGQGGTSPYTFETADIDDEQTIEDAGLTLSSSGLLSGTATQDGPISFSVIITDATGLSCTQTFTAPKPTGPDWSKLHWVATGNNSTGTIQLNGVFLPNGAPIAPTDCGTQDSLRTIYLAGNVDSIHFAPSIVFNDPGSFNCRLRIDVFAVATLPNQAISIGISNDPSNLVVINAAAFAALPVGTTNFDFVVPPNGGHLNIAITLSIFSPGLPLDFKLTLLNL